MGAVNYYNSASIKNQTPEQVFGDLVSESQYHSGHHYSGEIGMKSSFVIRKKFDASEDRSVVLDFIDEDIGENEKWGPSFAVIHGTRIYFYGYASE